MRKSGIYTAVFAAFLMTTTAFAADVTPSVNTQTADSAIQAPVQKRMAIRRMYRRKNQ